VILFLEMLENSLDLVTFNDLSIVRYMDDSLIIYDKNTNGIENKIEYFNKCIFTLSGLNNVEDIVKNQIFLGNILFKVNGKYFITLVINKYVKYDNREVERMLFQLLRGDYYPSIVTRLIGQLKKFYIRDRCGEKTQFDILLLNVLYKVVESLPVWEKKNNLFYRVIDYYSSKKKKYLRKKVKQKFGISVKSQLMYRQVNPHLFEDIVK